MPASIGEYGIYTLNTNREPVVTTFPKLIHSLTIWVNTLSQPFSQQITDMNTIRGKQNA